MPCSYSEFLSNQVQKNLETECTDSVIEISDSEAEVQQEDKMEQTETASKMVLSEPTDGINDDKPTDETIFLMTFPTQASANFKLRQRKQQHSSIKTDEMDIPEDDQNHTTSNLIDNSNESSDGMKVNNSSEGMNLLRTSLTQAAKYVMLRQRKQQHSRMHTDQRSYKCIVCSSEFPSSRTFLHRIYSLAIIIYLSINLAIIFR